MPKILTHLSWIFFVYSENERAHLHIYRKGKQQSRSAEIFLEKNGKRELEWASYGDYKKEIAQIEKIINENYDVLIQSVKKSMSGIKVKTIKK
ncbi:MAG: DUF4160 domain-containing protein [Bacteroidales bacterium]|nr:DUF4160 domain-containing protein [Bacteroidales bacterium]